MMIWHLWVFKDHYVTVSSKLTASMHLNVFRYGDSFPCVSFLLDVFCFQTYLLQQWSNIKLYLLFCAISVYKILLITLNEQAVR